MIELYHVTKSYSGGARPALKEISLKIDRTKITFREKHNNKEELTLRRDILDQQVVDTYNHKVIRINDIHMLPVDNALMMAHVDISVRGLFRRLGYEKFVDFFLRLVNPNAAYLRAENLIAWKYIQPLSINPVSMTIKVDIPQKKFSTIPAADFGEIFQDLSIKHQRRCLNRWILFYRSRYFPISISSTKNH